MVNWERVSMVTCAVMAVLAIAAFFAFRHKHPAPLPPLHALVQATKPTPVVVRQMPAKPAARPVYHRVLPGGRIDGRIDCKYVRSMTDKYSDVETYGPSIAGLSADTVRRLRVCFP